MTTPSACRLADWWSPKPSFRGGSPQIPETSEPSCDGVSYGYFPFVAIEEASKDHWVIGMAMRKDQILAFAASGGAQELGGPRSQRHMVSSKLQKCTSNSGRSRVGAVSTELPGAGPVRM